ncbi:hypothetical protein D3C81_144270 [compost metagenome]
MNEPITPMLNAGLKSLLSHMILDLLMPRFRDQYVHSGEVEVSGKLYTVFFKRVSDDSLEIHMHRNSKTIFLLYKKTVYDETLSVTNRFPEPGAAGYDRSFDDPWRWLKILATYIDKYPEGMMNVGS